MGWVGLLVSTASACAVVGIWISRVGSKARLGGKSGVGAGETLSSYSSLQPKQLKYACSPNAERALCDRSNLYSSTSSISSKSSAALKVVSATGSASPKADHAPETSVAALADGCFEYGGGLGFGAEEVEEAFVEEEAWFVEGECCFVFDLSSFFSPPLSLSSFLGLGQVSILWPFPLQFQHSPTGRSGPLPCPLQLCNVSC